MLVKDTTTQSRGKAVISALGYMTVVMAAIGSSTAIAQTLPSSADPSRITPIEDAQLPDRPDSPFVIPQTSHHTQAPSGAESITLLLKEINIEGATAYQETELSAIYSQYLQQEITLDTVWRIADDITSLYQNDGYFLSRAYIPPQEVDDGIITIQVVEGYLETVAIEGEAANHMVVDKLIDYIEGQQPLNAYDLESFMLRMNALPGQEFRAVVEPIENAAPGVTRLSLVPQEESGRGSVKIDNYGSRFLGPYQLTATYQDSFIPLQQTTISALTSIPTDEIQYIAFNHVVPFHPELEFVLSGNYVTSEPGAQLEPNDINSDSVEIGVGVNWRPIRQRQENLVATLQFTGQNTNGDILENNPLTRDRIRALRGSVSYDTSDHWNGYNYLTFGINQGVDILGASEAGDLNLSRAEAEPDFTVAHFNYVRQQIVSDEIIAIAQLSGQIASDPLFSAEEFGYGGQAFGRAFDPSEITGDHGLSTSIELRYFGLDTWQDTNFTPYTFYDIGKVWNDDAAGIDESGSSAGLGVRINHESGFAANLGVAWPLTRSINTPIYGNGKNPRLLLQVSYDF